MNKVPELEIIHSILNQYFTDTEPGGYATEDKDGTVYIYNKDDTLYAMMPTDVWFEFLDYNKEKEEKNEALSNE